MWTPLGAGILFLSSIGPPSPFGVAGAEAPGPGGPCVPSDTVACPTTDVAVSVDYTDSIGTSAGLANTFPSPIAAHDYFSFDDRRYAEVWHRVIDGCAVNGKIWFFGGSLSTLATTTRVVLLSTGQVRTYFDPVGTQSSFLDTNAFDCPMGPVAAGVHGVAPLLGQPDVARDLAGASAPRDQVRHDQAGFFCIEDATRLCMISERFRVFLDFTSGGGSGQATAYRLTDHSGAFALFSATSAEVVFAIRERCGSFDVSIGSQTDVEFTITVEDFQTGFVWSRTSPAGSIDNFTETAFAHAPCFSDGFESGGIAWDVVFS